MRLDTWLTENAHYESRSRAQQAIASGAVSVNGRTVTKPAYPVQTTDEVRSTPSETLRYVSRGGLKLELAIRQFQLSFQQKTVLDVGASTGGFTDCALQHGATQVVAVDIGSGQLHPSLQGHPQVRSLENTDIRTLEPSVLGQLFDWVVVDASFISLRHILPALPPFLHPESTGGVVALVKPQFEQVERRRFRGGIIRDERVHREVLAQVAGYARDSGLQVANSVATTPDEGRNQEFLLWLKPL